MALPHTVKRGAGLCLLITLAMVGGRGCGGGEFQAGEASSAGGSDGSGGTAGTGSGTTTSGGGGNPAQCNSFEDCDDQDPCTIDRCGANGTCQSEPRCAESQTCCDGICAECCGDDDCDDGVDCTQDSCTLGMCETSPDDSLCSDEEYCSLAQDCTPREACAENTDCDDGNPCTVDVCVAELCGHVFCPGGERCCEAGCVAGDCCGDFDCDDGLSCTVDVCDAGECEFDEVNCDGGTQCFEAAGTGVCSECNSADDCDDGIDCTENKCLGGSCQFPNGCEAPTVCDPDKDDCIEPAECNGDADCETTSACQHGACIDGACDYTDCNDDGLLCCEDVGCVEECCEDSQCSDGVECTVDTCEDGVCVNAPDNSACVQSGGAEQRARECHPTLGCIECERNEDCEAGWVGIGCSYPACVEGECTTIFSCPAGQACCLSECVDADNGCVNQ